MTCKNFQKELPALLFEPAALPSSEAALHLRACAACREVYASFQATFGLLDSWQAPEPSPYFDQKLAVRLREAQAEPAMNWFERLQTRLALNTGWQFRPAMAGALAVILLAGGGTVTQFTSLVHPKTVEASATVNDLQILDRNEQAFQQMDQLLQDDENGKPADGSQSPQPLS